MSYPFNDIAGVGQDEKSIKVVIEIPTGSSHKIEWDRRAGYFVLDRIEPFIFPKPANYGFIPQTLDDDGDELDALVITAAPLTTGVVIPKAIVLGVMKFKDDGEDDHKIICVPDDDRDCGPRRHLDDLGPVLLRQIEHHFSHYKDLKRSGTTNVLGFEGAQAAWEIIRECRQRAIKEPWW